MHKFYLTVQLLDLLLFDISELFYPIKTALDFTTPQLVHLKMSRQLWTNQICILVVVFDSCEYCSHSSSIKRFMAHVSSQSIGPFTLRMNMLARASGLNLTITALIGRSLYCNRG